MPQYAVLGNEGRAEGVRTLVEKAVMADTETDHNIQIGLLFVQELCLKNRIADMRPQRFLSRVKAYIGLPDGAGFACCAVNFETVFAEDCRRGTRLF